MEICEKGGQEYDIADAIKTFLGQMREGGIDVASIVIKELLQNADDAKAKNVTIILDERKAPPNFSEYKSFLSEKMLIDNPDISALTSPALLIRNDSFFKLEEDVKSGELDDFKAISKVASGHKESQASSAGRFGIGFNSVYFLTDTPVIFSRREVHIFDPLHHIVNFNGWRFYLNNYSSISENSVGIFKNIMEWFFPKIVMNFEKSFGEIAIDKNGDYKKTLFRLPLRQYKKKQDSLKILSDQLYTQQEERNNLLEVMAEQAAKSVLFLKHIETISFGILLEKDKPIEEIASIKITPNLDEFYNFINSVENCSHILDILEEKNNPKCPYYDRRISFEQHLNNENKEIKYRIYHTAKFNDQDLAEHRKKLKKNGERAIPWASIAIPLDLNTINFYCESNELPMWRVFLPLLEPGPSACIFNAAFFVGPSRQRVEFSKTDSSDEALRKTNWNKCLVDNLLVPLLEDISSDMPQIIEDLIKKHPNEYLSLFPATKINQKINDPKSLSEYFTLKFNESNWILKLYDIWDNEIEVLVNDENELVNDENENVQFESIPKWLIFYKECFKKFSNSSQKFISQSVANALKKRILDLKNYNLSDIALSVLAYKNPPNIDDLGKLLKKLDLNENDNIKEKLNGLWGIVCCDNNNQNGNKRYDKDYLFITNNNKTRSDIHHEIRKLNFEFSKTQWVKPNIGIPAMKIHIDNIVPANDDSAYKLLTKIVDGDKHDKFNNVNQIKPIVDFLCKIKRPISDIKLGFLVKTAFGKEIKRDIGIILLKLENPNEREKALWEGFLQKIFPEVDPDFSKELMKLLKNKPESKECLYSSDCVVLIAEEDNILKILDLARNNIIQSENQKQYQSFEEVINKNPNNTSISSIIIEKADKNWDDFDHSMKTTVLSLPIHRLANGKFVSLAEINEYDEEKIKKQFQLQSSDDIKDAPISLPNANLLHNENIYSNRFYRNRLSIEERGRTALLKESLKQIGDMNENSILILEYIVKYYEDKMESLKKSNESAHKIDYKELMTLFKEANIIKCIDGNWYMLSDCVQVWRKADTLEKQEWKPNELNEILTNLYERLTIATTEKKFKTLITKIDSIRLKENNNKTLKELALTSESDKLTFKQRIKIIGDNLNDRTNHDKTSSIINTEYIKTFHGEYRLKDAKLLIENDVPDVVKANFFPEAVNIEQFSKKYNIKKTKAKEILQTFDIKKINLNSIKDNLKNRFSDVWPTINDNQKINLLKYIASHDDLSKDLISTVKNHEVICICEKNNKFCWVKPDNVPAPSLLKTEPPLLSKDQEIDIKQQDAKIIELYEKWCGIKNIKNLIHVVIESTQESDVVIESTQESDVSKLYEWLDSIIVKNNISKDELAHILKNKNWVLACKGNETKMANASKIFYHKSQKIIKKAFWSPKIKLPKFTEGSIKDFDFKTALPPKKENIQSLYECLPCELQNSEDILISFYELLYDIIKKTESFNKPDNKFYSLFRKNSDFNYAKNLFLGNENYKEDFGTLIYCLKACNNLPKQVNKMYKRFGIEEIPTIDQLLIALSNINDDKNRDKTYKKIASTIVSLKINNIANIKIPDIKILSCAKTYESISKCYIDSYLKIPSEVAEESQKLVIYQNKITMKLIKWIRKNASQNIHELNELALLELQEEFQKMDDTTFISQVLSPWRDFFSELNRNNSILNAKAKETGFCIPESLIEIVVIDKICIRYRLKNNLTINQSKKFNGINIVAFIEKNKIYIKSSYIDKSFITRTKELNEIDKSIATEVLKIIKSENIDDNIGFILNYLERPGTILNNIRKENQQYDFFHYKDQSANLEFNNFYNKYKKTKDDDERQKLEREMRDIIKKVKVELIRKDISNYGYDDFSLFAELIQNAEDAYIQMDWLRMEPVEQYSISFNYKISNDKNQQLLIEHYGRPFNYWRHKGVFKEELKNDVEGVLKTKGSFKQNDEKTVGKFGLGFKTVYLLTDCPKIHSDIWHFEIENCNLPKELPRPDDLSEKATRIILPLKNTIKKYEDKDFINLIPFLRKINKFSFNCNKFQSNFVINAEKIIDYKKKIYIELITVEKCLHVREGKVRFLRCSHKDHKGQLALYISPEKLPDQWSTAFMNDLFVVLPLKVKLNCGIAVSNLFEIQSGRTEFIEHEDNIKRFKEVADLINALPEALKKIASEYKIEKNKMFEAFWSLWHWNDNNLIIRELQKHLLICLERVPDEACVIPTLDKDFITNFKKIMLFYFSKKISQKFIDALIDIGNISITYKTNEKNIILTKQNVLSSNFAQNYLKICQYVNKETELLTEITWEIIGETCSKNNYFSENPKLLNTLAETLSEQQFENIQKWLINCKFLGYDFENKNVNKLAQELIRSDFEGNKFFPKRFLNYLDNRYNDKTIELLKKIGLMDKPSIAVIQEIFSKNKSLDECYNLFTFLYEKNRYKRIYDELQSFFKKEQIIIEGKALNIKDVLDKLIKKDSDNKMFSHNEFKAWLIPDDSSTETKESGNGKQSINATKWLNNLYEWWEHNDTEIVENYNSEVYPSTKPFVLNKDYFPNDKQFRKNWISLFILGACETMGYYKRAAHRNFLNICEKKGWLDVFSNPEINADRWIEVLENYLDSQISDEINYFHWFKQFVSIYQLARWLEDYVHLFVEIEKYKEKSIEIEQIISPRTSTIQQRGGIDAPPLTKILGIGNNFVLRELVRNSVIKQPLIHRHCYVPVKRVREILIKIGCKGLEGEYNKIRKSSIIYNFLRKHLGEKKATFNNAFDIPLLAVAEKQAPEYLQIMID